MVTKLFDLDRYAQKARQAVAEGIVLLKNDNQVLPLQKGNNIAVFGRSQFNYFKSGTGSGGLVNTSYVVSILDALEQSDSYHLNKNVKNTYLEWIEQHPFDAGQGWASEPWSQEEMPLSMDLVDTARQESDTAIIIIGRTAGEDKDATAEAGSYLLTETEEEMLQLVCKKFEKTIVLLNVGNIIDMKWVKKYDPSAVLYVWQGGQEGGNGVLDVINGTVSPSGKLTDTIAFDIADYPSTPYFGDEKENHYVEDIYVGYRYFETFANDKVLYPFGYGLSYTTFSIEIKSFSVPDEAVKAVVTVTNTGAFSGKEVVQVYLNAPQGKLGKPLRSLSGFAKTETLKPGESETITIECGKATFASYDDSGVTGHKSSYVLEEGTYEFYIGNDVRNASLAGSFVQDEIMVIEKLSEVLAPVTTFERMKPIVRDNEKVKIGFEIVPQRTIAIEEKMQRPEAIPFTGDKGYKLSDVADEKVTIEQFIAQLSEEDLTCVVRGEGMSSPKVTPGTAGAFGGVTDELLDFGIPLGCCADGPSGIRMDCGTIAFSLPNGTCLAASFNEDLSQELFEIVGLELRKNRVDTLLGPGMNLHRNPLNGRNFEYFSEDPLLTGKIAAAQLKGMHKYGVTGTIKHFAANNQEYKRNDVDAVVSERALREIYLKCFEIAVKEGQAYSIMSTYGPINGLWTASNYDLLTKVLREEWGFDGIVMTDWWAKGNDEGEQGSIKNIAAMVRNQNDLFMVTANAKENTTQDNAVEGLASGRVTIGEYQRSAMNICKALMKFPTFDRIRGIESELDRELEKSITEEDAAMFDMQQIKVAGEHSITPDMLKTQKGASTIFQVTVKERGKYQIQFSCRSKIDLPLAQLPVSFFKDNALLKTITLTGKDTEWKTESIDLGVVFNPNFYLKIYFGQTGMEISDCKIEMTESLEEQIRIMMDNR
ncbi:glycoside hydrolase family 3 protein [Bacillus sp. FJAT-49711]|uniref:glycoside hydrolase family 3 protein n=1 Tax=Bacillus sp. FJAT-49711 TaxID=2833585 RepID=UPI001BCA5C96|nr:glycoside hydrolase family 3 protein [Bacillus sp. FJAT-49711]MBS4220373.1 glycoside hydrolase family 3 protein [Bacillus sp. FJAT-49711]